MLRYLVVLGSCVMHWLVRLTAVKIRRKAGVYLGAWFNDLCALRATHGPG